MFCSVLYHYINLCNDSNFSIIYKFPDILSWLNIFVMHLFFIFTFIIIDITKKELRAAQIQPHIRKRIDPFAAL